MKEFTIIDTIQVTRIIKTDIDYTEKELINEGGKAITNTLVGMGYDDAIVLNHQVFIRDNLDEKGEE